MRPYRDLPKGSPRLSLGDTEPEVGQGLEIVGRRWTVSDHSSYDNPEGYHVDEWECQSSDGAETAYLLRETGADTSGEVRWFFTRPIPISAVTMQGGKPFGEVAAELATPPDALIYRGLAHGFDEQTDGTYSEDPGDESGKKTWDYWDAKQENNLAVERWADGRIDCYYGRRVDPAKIRMSEAPTLSSWLSLASTRVSTGALSPAHRMVVVLVVAAFFGILVIATRNVLVDGLTGVVAAVAVFFGRSLFVSARSGATWLAVIVGLAALFSRFPPLTTVAGFSLLVVVPAAIARWLASATEDRRAMVENAGVATAIATAAAGLYHFYRFAPVPPSIGQYGLAIGPAVIAGIIAAAIAFAVGRLFEAVEAR